MNISKLERKFGKYAIPNLSLYLIIGYVIGYVIDIISPEMSSYITFDPYLILNGQIWRLFTWIITPPEGLDLFTIIMLMFYYSVGNSLERAWGTFRYNLYLFTGFIFTVIGGFVLYFMLSATEDAMICGELISFFVSTYYVNMSIFLAIAATFPEMEVLLYFVLPIKVKWLGVLYGAFAIYEAVYGGWAIRMMIIASLLNFIIFFFTNRNMRKYSPRQMKRRYDFNKKVHMASQSRYENGARHKCAVCGQTELDNPDLTFRYCSKCSGNKEYCNNHLFTHTHN